MADSAGTDIHSQSLLDVKMEQLARQSRDPANRSFLLSRLTYLAYFDPELGSQACDDALYGFFEEYTAANLDGGGGSLSSRAGSQAYLEFTGLAVFQEGLAYQNVCLLVVEAPAPALHALIASTLLQQTLGEGKVLSVSDDLPARAFAAFSSTTISSVRAQAEDMESAELRAAVANVVVNLLKLSKIVGEISTEELEPTEEAAEDGEGAEGAEDKDTGMFGAVRGSAYREALEGALRASAGSLLMPTPAFMLSVLASEGTFYASKAYADKLLKPVTLEPPSELVWPMAALRLKY